MKAIVNGIGELEGLIRSWFESNIRFLNPGTFMDIKVVRVRDALHVCVSPPLIIDIERLKAMSVNELELSTRAANVLNSRQISTVGELMAMSREDIYRSKNCGDITVRELQLKLEMLGIVVGWV